MSRNEKEIRLNTEELLMQARSMKKWELIEEVVYNHSRILKEMKQKEPQVSIIDLCKIHIAVIEQALNEKMHDADENTVSAFKEIYREVTGLFHFLFAMHEPAAMQLYGIALPEKQETTHNIPFPPAANRRSRKTRKVFKRG